MRMHGTHAWGSILSIGSSGSILSISSVGLVRVDRLCAVDRVGFLSVLSVAFGPVCGQRSEGLDPWSDREGHSGRDLGAAGAALTGAGLAGALPSAGDRLQQAPDDGDPDRRQHGRGERSGGEAVRRRQQLDEQLQRDRAGAAASRA